MKRLWLLFICFVFGHLNQIVTDEDGKLMLRCSRCNGEWRQK